MARRHKTMAETEKQWPTLFQFLAGWLHEDWPVFSGTPEGAIDDAIHETALEIRRTVAKEWRDWNRRYASVADPRRIVNDGFGVNVRFKRPIDAHKFMELVYEKLLDSIKDETQTWKNK